MRLRTILYVLFGATVFVGTRVPYAQETLEYPIKAIFLHKFAEFVTWPEYAIHDDFTICIVGKDPFGPLLEDAINGAKISGRPVVAKRITSISADSDCAVAYFGASDLQAESSGMAAIRNEPILTVTDEAVDDNALGIIHFIIRNDRVRFSIDERAAAQNGLSISSRLLDLSSR